MSFYDFPLKLDFGDPAEEVKRCRSDCALFDFSFIESARLQGSGALRVAEALSNRPLANMREGDIRYSVRINSESDAVADLTVWRRTSNTFEVMSGRREDILDLVACDEPDLTVVPLTPGRSTFSIQGPGALKALSGLCDTTVISTLDYFTFCETRVAGIPCVLGRLGYTGERGFEIISARANGVELWDMLCRVARPAGFIAADTLRIEAGLVLFANEFAIPVAPSEARLGAFCRTKNWRQPRIELVSMHAESETASWPWRPESNLSRPQMPDEVVVTSACRSAAAGGVLALGYVCAGVSTAQQFCDRTGVFKNIQLAATPFLASAKTVPRDSWR